MPGSEFGPLAARESAEDMAIFRQLFTPENRHENGGEDEWRWDRRSGLCPSLVEFCGEYCSVRFHPTIAYGTAAIRANTQLDGNTIAYWTVHASKIYGSSMMFGIGTDQALLSTPFVWTDLLGGFIASGQNPKQKQNRNEWQSCGLSHKGVFFAGGSPTIFCAPFPEGAEVEVGLLFDGPRRRLGFVRDGQWLGWAPTKLALHDGHGKDIIFYPMVASTAQRSQFKLVRQMHWKMRAPKQLLHICKDSISTAIMAEFAKMPNKKEMMENDQSPSMTKVANANEEEDATLLLLRRRIDELGLPRTWSDTIFVECVQRQTTNGINHEGTESQKEQQKENGENGNVNGAVPRAKAANDSPRPSRRFLLKSLKHQMGRSSAKRPRPPLCRTTSIEMAQPPTSPF